jgi:phage-related protein
MKTVCTAEVVTFTLSAPSPMRQLFPKYLYRADFCMYVSNYKGPQCRYAGALANCDGTYSGANGCVVHDNAGRFGAFPGIGTNGMVLAAQQ